MRRIFGSCANGPGGRRGSEGRQARRSASTRARRRRGSDRPISGEAGADAASGFVDSLEAAYTLIGDHPAAGSPRYAHELDLPGLRSILLKRYPYLVFYVERDDHLDVWRVLHVHRDIPARMRPPEL